MRRYINRILKCSLRGKLQLTLDIFLVFNIRTFYDGFPFTSTISTRNEDFQQCEKRTINNAKKKARGKRGKRGEKERNTAEIKKLKWSLTKRTPTGPPFESRFGWLTGMRGRGTGGGRE